MPKTVTDRPKGKLRTFVQSLDLWLIVLCVGLAAFGLMIIFSATHNTSLRYTVVQGAGIAMGVCAMVAVSLFDYRTLASLWKIYMPFAVLLMVLTFFFGITPQGTDNKAWLEIPFVGVTIQPSELLKLAYIFTFSKHIERLGKNIETFKGVLSLAAHALAVTGMVVVQQDWGSAMVFVFITLTMMFVGGVQLRYFAILLGGVAAAVPLLWTVILKGYQKMRILSVYFPELDTTGDWVYQQKQGKISIGSGGLWGRGWLEGPRTQSVKVPAQHNDFILSALGEEFGFIGCFAVLLVLALILLRIMHAANTSSDVMGRCICMGVFGIILFQTIINVGMVLSLLPVVGVTLPFFSSGGTSVVVSFLSIGMVLSVYRTRERYVFGKMLVRR